VYSKIWSVLKLLYLYLAYWVVGLDEEMFYISKGNHLFEMEFYSAAAKAYKKALKETDSPYIYSSLGYCYLNSGMPDKALEYLKIAYSRRSTPDFAVGLVYAHHENGNVEESLNLFKNLLKMKIDNDPHIEKELEKMKEMFTEAPNQRLDLKAGN
jgi:tetratricopeptide (TPR) repeat protein